MGENFVNATTSKTTPHPQPFRTRPRGRSFLERLKRNLSIQTNIEEKELPAAHPLSNTTRAEINQGPGKTNLLVQNVKEMLRQGFSVSEVKKVATHLLGAPNEIELPGSRRNSDAMNKMDVDTEENSHRQPVGGFQQGPEFSRYRGRRRRSVCVPNVNAAEAFAPNERHRRNSFDCNNHVSNWSVQPENEFEMTQDNEVQTNFHQNQNFVPHQMSVEINTPTPNNVNGLHFHCDEVELVSKRQLSFGQSRSNSFLNSVALGQHVKKTRL